jgi:hypothetical protein
VRRPDHAELVLLGMVTGALVADGVLCRRDRRLVTDVLRTPPAMAGLLYLLAHVVDVLGPFDLFRAVARRIPPIREVT